MLNNDRRLIEDLIPIREISAEASREKSLRHGNISTLHLWWARRPIVAARAAVYGALVPAPSDAKERDMYMERMRKLCSWDIPNGVLEQARKDILAANGGHAPRVLDMFAGGGSIPLEALRLGCEAYAVELNPVAHIIELCTLVYPQKYGPSLVADVKKWGEWVIERAKAQLAEFYPSPSSEPQADDGIVQSTFTGEQKQTQSNGTLTPIAYLWTRTVSCPNPTCGATVPLVRQTWLRKKEGNYIALRMTPDHTTKKVHFERVQSPTLEGLGFDPEAGSKRGNATCPFCGAIATADYTKEQGQKGHIDRKLMAVVCTRQDGQGKNYLADNSIESLSGDENTIKNQIDTLCHKHNLNLPTESVPQYLTGGTCYPYGLTRFVDLFTPRQLIALLTFTAEVRRAHATMLKEGIEPERAAAITTYLGLMVDRLADRDSTICHWDNTRETIANTYARQALPMVWDFVEVNPFGEASGGVLGALKWILEVMQSLVGSGQPALLYRTSAVQLPLENGIFDAVITDPPYYDNVSYADLSDFFYVWLKRSIGLLYPEHFSTPLTPKKQEAVMAAYRHNKNKEEARQSYEAMMAQAFSEARRVLKPGMPLICVYAHKTTLGWSTLIEALRHAGFVITEAWPLDTEMKARSVSQGTAALASSIFLVARRRENETTGDYVSQVRPQLTSIVNERLDTLIRAGVSGADLIIATLGAGLRAYTQFARVELSNGDELDVVTYLGEVEREVAQHVLQRLLRPSEEGEESEDTGARVAMVDVVTRFYVTGRFFYGESAAPFDDMNLLARGMGVELDGPRGLTQGKQGLAKKVKDTIVLRDYRSRGDDEHLGQLSESGNPAPLIDVLQRLLWLQDEQPNEVQDFLMKTHPHIEQLRLVALALRGHALAPAGSDGATKHERTEEQKAVDRLLAGWRGLFTAMAGKTLWG